MDSDTSPLAYLVDHPRRTNDQGAIGRIVGHITGLATWRNAERNKQHPLARLRDILFCNPKNESCSTYAIDPWGEIWQYCRESQRPWAQGLNVSSAAAKVPPRWWLEEWADFGLEHPLGLVGGRDPNINSISIEVVQWGGQYCPTRTQYLACSRLIADCCERHELLCDPLHVIGHEDVNPWARGDAGGGWDPGARRGKPRWDWDFMLGLVDAALEDVGGQNAAIDVLIAAGLAIETPDRPAWMPAPLALP